MLLYEILITKIPEYINPILYSLLEQFTTSGGNIGTDVDEYGYVYLIVQQLDTVTKTYGIYFPFPWPKDEWDTLRLYTMMVLHLDDYLNFLPDLAREWYIMRLQMYGGEIPIYYIPREGTDAIGLDSDIGIDSLINSDLLETQKPF